MGKGAIVLMHGLRANRLELVDRIRFLHKAGFSLLAFDFQGSGGSVGKNLTFGFLESRDAEASVKFIKEKLPEEKIGVLGISIGGAAFVRNDAKDLDGYVTEKALDGLFYMVTQEEEKIRKDPIGRTTKILRDVFGILK